LFEIYFYRIIPDIFIYDFFVPNEIFFEQFNEIENPRQVSAGGIKVVLPLWLNSSRL